MCVCVHVCVHMCACMCVWYVSQSMCTTTREECCVVCQWSPFVINSLCVLLGLLYPPLCRYEECRVKLLPFLKRVGFKEKGVLDYSGMAACNHHMKRACTCYLPPPVPLSLPFLSPFPPSPIRPHPFPSPHMCLSVPQMSTLCPCQGTMGQT